MKNKLTFSILFSLFIALSFTASAQSLNREAGIRLSGLNNFDFIYKRGKMENRFTRFRFAYGNFVVSGRDSEVRISSGLGIAVGREKRKPISEKIFFIHGWEPALNVSFRANEDNYLVNIMPSLGYVLGLQLDLLDNFYINLETIPRLNSQLRIDDGQLSNSYSAALDFSSNAVALSLVYKFKSTSR